MAATNPLTSIEPPWIHLAIRAPGETAGSVLSAPPGFVTRIVDGRRCRTKARLLSELARALDAPESCRRNWDAFEECLADLDWLPAKGYIIAITEAEHLLSTSPEDYATFIDIVHNVAKEWATPRDGEWPRPAVPFHACLVVTPGRETARKDWRVPLLAR